jgi:predicted ATPase/class 3 adenylate cyclase
MQNQPLPSGTVTFLFTDIEGSTKRWEANPAAMQSAFSRQEAILRQAIRANGGYAYKMIGDAFQAAFPTALQALQAAIDAQRALHSESWSPETEEVRVRIALHTGTTEERGDDYIVPALNRVARLLSAGHGGQVLLSEVTHGLVRDALPSGVAIVDMGEHRLKDLTRPEHIFQLVVSGLPSEFPPLKTLDYRPNNLPVQPTPLIGREKELAKLQELLEREEVRLVTLTGPGGTGKTRLGLQLASEALDDYHDGAWFVDLSPLTDSRLVVSTIASVLGVKEAGGTPIVDMLKEYLKDKSMLLVLDNFEQVVGAVKEVSMLIASCPHLEVLATSRIPLHIRAEKEYPVPPLSVPDVRHLPPLESLIQYDAVRLFIERATDIKPDFQVTNESAPAVAEICARLDGLPLAIELAAARVRVLTPQAVLERLQSRLRLLTGGSRDLPVRQQTLRSAIEWSYDLLVEGEQQLFRRMAVFQGGNTLQALEVVCNFDGQLKIDTLDGAESLASKSLVRQWDGSGAELRLLMLETIHEYAREKLAENPREEGDLLKAHALYFMRLAEKAEPHLRDREQPKWLNVLEVEHDNIRAALKWAREKGTSSAEALDAGLRTVAAMEQFWITRGYYSEGREYSDVLLSIADNADSADGGKATPARTEGEVPSGKDLVKVLCVGSILAFLQSDYPAARSLGEQALVLAQQLGDKREIARALDRLSGAAMGEDDDQTALALLEQRLAILQELGDKRGTASTLWNIAALVHARGDRVRARSLFRQGLALQEEVGNPAGMANTLLALAAGEYEEGRRSEALALYDQGIALFREVGNYWRLGYWTRQRGLWAYEEGDYAQAYSLFQQALAIWKNSEDKRGRAIGLTALGSAAAKLEEGKRGAILLGAGQTARTAVGQVWNSQDDVPYKQGLESARSQMGEEEFEKHLAQGRAMSAEEAIEYAVQES